MCPVIGCGPGQSAHCLLPKGTRSKLQFTSNLKDKCCIKWIYGYSYSSVMCKCVIITEPSSVGNSHDLA